MSTPNGKSRRIASKNEIHDAAAVADWNRKKWVWVPDDVEGFVAGWVVKEEGELSTVAFESGESETRVVPSLDLSRVNPPTYDGADDIADLTYLNEASVVHNLKTRYASGNIYTYSGLFLVAINPYRNLKIYSHETVEAYKHARRDENPPHVFAVAQNAWANMVAHREQSQSVLVTGESGAGKTENTKKVIQYLAAIAADPLPTSRSLDQLQIRNFEVAAVAGKKLGELETQILQANPILEAFGNAQTIKNNNSSRFGKFVRLFFTPGGSIAGATIDWYLLEKSRVTGRSQLERNFHIFFQLLKGADSATKAELLLTGGPKDYEYLKHSRLDVHGMDDRIEWKGTRSALDIVGFTPEEQTNMFIVLSSILNLGNIVVGGDRSDQAFIRDQSQLEKVAFLLGIPDASDLLNALVRPKVKAGREWVVQARTKKQVADELAALSKALYEKNFGEMVERINAALGRPSTKTFIGVLDIAGFEIFEINGFEQLCINLTNEKLQQFFNHHMFVLEQEEYEREEIEWDFVNFGLELQPTIDLIESNAPLGILACLDDACIMPKATDALFTTKLHELATAKPVAPLYKRYTPSRFEVGFTVSHYAGDVDYRTEGWLDKNRDPLSDPLSSLLANSTNPYIASLFAEFADVDPTIVVDGPRTRVRRGAFRTVGLRHRERLAALMTQLQETQPHFVRCIVPNLDKSPSYISTPLMLDQLRCNGVLEGIRIARLGYPNRLAFSDFRRRFELLAPGVVPKGFVDGGRASGLILKSLQLDTRTYKLGLTKVFFKAGILAELEERRDDHLSEIFTRVQAACRRFTVRRQANKILNRAAAVRTIQRNARLYIELRSWAWWPLFQRVRPLLAAARSDDEMRRKESELLAIREKAQKDEEERTRLEKVKLELEASQAKMEASLVDERAASAEKEALLRLSKEREAALQEDLALMQQDLDVVDAQLERAMSAKAEADQRITHLNEAFANSTQLLATLQVEQAAWKARELELTSKTLVQKEEWEQVLEDRSRSVAAVEDLRRQLAERTQDGQREQERLASSVSSLEQRLATTTKESKELRSKLVALEQDTRVAKEELVVLRRGKRELEATLKEKETEVARLLADRPKLIAERDAAVAKAGDLSDKFSATSTALAESNRLLDASRESQSRSEADLQALKHLLESNSTDHQRQVQLNKVKDAELEQLRLAVSQGNAERAIAERNAADERNRFQKEAETIRAEIATLKNRNDESTKRATATAKRLAELESANADLERQQQSHALEVELVRTQTAEATLREREKSAQEMAAIQSRFGHLEDEALQARRAQESALRDVAALSALLESEQAAAAAREKARLALESKVEQQHVVLADLDKINGNLRSELAATRARLAVAEDKAGRTVVEHVRVLEEAQRLQNADMDRMRAERAERDAYVRTLERARASLTQSLEDLQHERELERREAWASKPTKPLNAPKDADQVESERKLRQLAELNVTRLQQEIRRQQSELEQAAREASELRLANVQMERELNSIAASDHTESLFLPSARPNPPPPKSIVSMGRSTYGAQPLPAQPPPPLQPSGRRRNYE